jgi:hypothetical protein
MLAFSRHYFQSAELVTRFDRFPEVRRTQFVFEDELRSEFPAPSQVVNQGSNVPPDAPRFVITNGKRGVLVSEVAAQINLDFADAPLKTDVISVVRKYADLLDKAVATAIPTDKRDFSGLVLKLAFSYGGDQETLAAFLYDTLVKSPAPAKVASVNIDLGFQPTETAFLNLNLYTYKRVSLAAAPSAAPLFIDLDDLDPNEIGLEIKIDANNRPIRRKHNLDLSLRPLCDLIADGYTNTLNKLLGDEFAQQRRI